MHLFLALGHGGQSSRLHLFAAKVDFAYLTIKCPSLAVFRQRSTSGVKHISDGLTANAEVLRMSLQAV